MANEIAVTASLQVRKDGLQYISRPQSGVVDMTTGSGPTPGVVAVTDDGVDINLSALTTPGWCHMYNLSEDYYVDVGIWEPDTTFYPVLRLDVADSRGAKPCVLRLSPHLGQQFSGTGTGTGTENATLRAKAAPGASGVKIVVSAFDA